MSAQHTAGPWVDGLESDWFVETDSSNTYCHVGPEGGDPVAIVVSASLWDDAQLDANARLIAAAPELLELAYQYQSDLRHPPTSDSVERRLERIAAVLAKVGGQ